MRGSSAIREWKIGQVAMVAAEIASLEAAIVTAKRHVADAEAAKADEAERGKAREALALLDDFSQRGKLLDKSLDKFVRQYDELAREQWQWNFTRYFRMTRRSSCSRRSW